MARSESGRSDSGSRQRIQDATVTCTTIFRLYNDKKKVWDIKKEERRGRRRSNKSRLDYVNLSDIPF